MKLKFLVTSLALQKIKEVGMGFLGKIIFIILKSRKLELFRGHLFSNAVKIMLFISDAQYYVPVK